MDATVETGRPRQSLTPAERHTYATEGLVVPRYRLPEGAVLGLRRALDGLIADNPAIRPEQLVNAHIRRGGPGGVKGRDEFLRMAMSPEILDLVADLIGPDLILWGCQVFCKPAGDGMEVPWHQDGHYWPIKPLATCTVWIAIDDSTTENGCMGYIPRSHRGGLLPHAASPRDRLVLDLEVDPGAYSASTATDVVLEAGQMSMHDVYLIHGSRPNRSSRRRAGLAIRYMPSTSHFDRSVVPMTSYGDRPVDFRRRPIWLVRGVDRSGLNDFRVGHEADG